MDTQARQPQAAQREAARPEAAQTPMAAPEPARTTAEQGGADRYRTGRQRWERRFAASRVRDADFSTLSGARGGPGVRAAARARWYPGSSGLAGRASTPSPAASTPAGYRGRAWTIRQFSGFGNARQTNERYKMLLAAGGTGLSVAFDMPTLMGCDSDDPRSLGEVGHCGVAIDSAADMDVLFAASRWPT